MQHEAAKEQSFRMRFILYPILTVFFTSKKERLGLGLLRFFFVPSSSWEENEKKKKYTRTTFKLKRRFLSGHTYTALSLLPGSRRVVFIHSENQLYIRRGEDNSRRGRRRSAAEEKDFALTTRFCRRNDDDGRLVSLERKNDDDVDKHRIRDASRG